jgi:hypothetical protein
MEQKTLSLGYVDCEQVQRIRVRQGKAEWVLDLTGTVETHDPMDRVGGPYRIHAYVESDGEQWFMFSVVDCAFPLRDLVRGSSWEDAYETYVDWAAEHRHIAIDQADFKDYGVETDHATCNFTSHGKLVETENVHGDQVALSAIEFRVPEFTLRRRHMD